MKNIAILGSTGSIGRNALEVIRNFRSEFKVTALSANSDVDALYKQAKEFKPKFICVSDNSAAVKLSSRLGSRFKVFTGEEGLKELVKEKIIEQVLIAISGSSALMPLLSALDSGKQIALANKEALVMAGAIVMERAKKHKAEILPIDSEQSAIWQCLEGEDKNRLRSIYLTASGGPFRKTAEKNLKRISIREVLKHPRWKMGRKITVDSATLMNKGLELLEAMFLFNIPAEKIRILIHPEAIVHSMVEFSDGVVLAQLSNTDMRIPIQYALTYPKRLKNSLPGVNFFKLKALNFEKPDFKKFPCLGLAYKVADELGTAPAVMNAANEASVDEFLKRRLAFTKISVVIEKVLSRHKNVSCPGLRDILEADKWARHEAYKIIGSLN
ncbi:MAG: 1-deoxy-D-xylulose-5-phosphate reductoisomerase [Candidatus Omnitrophota bacterium]|jgi:1-deoxy-D-xylulose-5-phosphate reductoisomerase